MTGLISMLAALTGALGVALIFVWGSIAFGNRRIAVASRLQRWGSGQMTEVERSIPRNANIDLGAVSDFVVGQVNRVVAEQSFAEKMQRRLARADLKLTAAEFFVINGAAVLAGLAVSFLLFGGSLLWVLVLVAAGAVLPHWYVWMKERQRLKRFNGQLSDTIGMLSNSLRSGYSMLQSMDLVSREMDPPVSDEFQRVTREVGLGLTPEEALGNLVRRINSADLELMVTAINVQREVGGNLSEILDIIANTIRERVKLQGEIKTLTAQQTMAGYIITGLPIGLFMFLYTIDPKYMGTFWTWVPCGWIMGIGSLIMMGVGYFVMRKIVAIEV